MTQPATTATAEMQPTAKRGRPRDPERVERVLAAAGVMFQAQGFEKTSMEQVAKEANVSKMTVYSYFPSKEALFEAAVARGTQNALRAEMPTMDPTRPREMLTAYGRSLMELTRHPQVARLMTMLFNLGDTHPQVREGFYQQGPELMSQTLANYLRLATRMGTLKVEHPELAAEQFNSMFCSLGQLRIWLNLARPTAEEDARLLKANVEVFMKAYGPD
jgi:AcrR family transcriptional regulator